MHLICLIFTSKPLAPIHFYDQGAPYAKRNSFPGSCSAAAAADTFFRSICRPKQTLTLQKVNVRSKRYTIKPSALTIQPKKKVIMTLWCRENSPNVAAKSVR